MVKRFVSKELFRWFNAHISCYTNHKQPIIPSYFAINFQFDLRQDIKPFRDMSPCLYFYFCFHFWSIHQIHKKYLVRVAILQGLAGIYLRSTIAVWGSEKLSKITNNWCFFSAYSYYFENSIQQIILRNHLEVKMSNVLQYRFGKKHKSVTTVFSNYQVC